MSVEHHRETRLELGLTQEDAALLHGVDERTIVRWETADSEPGPGRIPWLAALEVYAWELPAHRKPHQTLKRLLHTQGPLAVWRVVLCAVLP